MTKTKKHRMVVSVAISFLQQQECWIEKTFKRDNYAFTFNLLFSLTSSN